MTSQTGKQHRVTPLGGVIMDYALRLLLRDQDEQPLDAL